MGVKFGAVKFHPHRCNVSPLRGEKPQNRPLSNLNNRRFALRTKLPVNKRLSCHREGGARHICASDIMSYLQMHGSMKKLGKDAWRRPIHNPLTYTKMLIFTTQNPPLE